MLLQSNKNNNWLRLLTPSWISGLFSVLISAAVATWTALAIYYEGSSVQFLIEEQNQQSTTVDEGYKLTVDHLANSPVLADITLIVLWAGIGMVAYLFVTGIYGAFSNARKLKSETRYVNLDRQTLLKEVYISLALRAGVLLAWFGYLKVTFSAIVPYAIALIQAGTNAGNILFTIGYFVAAACLLALCVHLHVIFLRLLYLKPRLGG